MHSDETICAIATAPGVGAIAIVRVSGPEAVALAGRLFRTREGLRERYATYGTIVDEGGEAIDRGIAILSLGPHTYTGEDTLELQLHGSPVLAGETMRAAIACGARAATPGEFTRRAFLNGRLDLHAASSVADLIAAESRSAARSALANLGGGLANEVRALRAQLAHVLEELAATLDFPDEVPEPEPARVLAEVAAVIASLERLRADGEAGRLVREGVSVAIVGPPNAGKSSLLNALLGEERALVSEIAGTTRDTIEEAVAIDGVRVRMVDTAGIRDHADRLEAAGIERSQRALESARIVLLVLDGSAPLGADAEALLVRTADRARVVFFNKADLGDAGVRAIAGETVTGSVRVDATIEALRSALARVGWGGVAPDLERPHIASAREFDAIHQALRSLHEARATIARGEATDFVARDLQNAYGLLGHVTGETATEELLDGIFARFCIGK